MKRVMLLMCILTFALWSMPAAAEDCVDIELGARLVTSEPYDILELYFFAVNCGVEDGTATFLCSLSKDGNVLGTAECSYPMPAGIPIEVDVTLPVPHRVPAGTYTLCITMTMGAAADTACASIALDEDNNVTDFEDVTSPMATSRRTWGGIKKLYR